MSTKYQEITDNNKINKSQWKPKTEIYQVRMHCLRSD